MIKRLNTNIANNNISQIWKEPKYINKTKLPFINELYTGNNKNNTTVNQNEILNIETDYLKDNFHTAQISNNINIKYIYNLIDNQPNNAISPDDKSILDKYYDERLSSTLNQYILNSNNNINETLTKLPDKREIYNATTSQKMIKRWALISPGGHCEKTYKLLH